MGRYGWSLHARLWARPKMSPETCNCVYANKKTTNPRWRFGGLRKHPNNPAHTKSKSSKCWHYMGEDEIPLSLKLWLKLTVYHFHFFKLRIWAVMAQLTEINCWSLRHCTVASLRKNFEYTHTRARACARTHTHTHTHARTHARTHTHTELWWKCSRYLLLHCNRSELITGLDKHQVKALMI